MSDASEVNDDDIAGLLETIEEHEETIARQARAIEILKNCILKEDHRCGIWREGREALELAAIEQQGEGK